MTNTIAWLWILSDLHLETLPHPDAFAPTPPDFDVLVCAGDVWRADPTHGFRVLRRLAGQKPVVCVLGNHEHWNSVLGERLPAARKAAEAYGVTLLQGDAVTLAGCRFVGTTLWSDYALAGDTVKPDGETGEAIRVEQEVEHGPGTALLTIGATVAQHRIERARLVELIDAHTGPEPLVVVTHHAPHPDCVPPQDHGTFLAGNGASDLSPLLDTGRIDLWVHGHLHHSVQMALASGTLIRCNPAGTRFSNSSFDPALTMPAREICDPIRIRDRLAPVLAMAQAAGPYAPTTWEEEKRFMDEIWGEED
ncbi:metallophosphoesterase [Aureimonas sp. AU40]|uniref:metallophosphoesterase n=2 Tax=unclassified Aureimonas TaxID=2615206 RepID=UPI000B0CF9A5|nr:metallophosphoesterase [Aureimonas sp. AU40]